MAAVEPIFYIDTNVIRDCIRGRNKESVAAMTFIRRNKWKCYTSIFSLMELADTEKEQIFFDKKRRKGWDANKILSQRRNMDLSSSDLNEAAELIETFLKEYDFVEQQNLDKAQSWERALKIASETNLRATDIIHLTTAAESQCNIILTSDEPFIKYGKLFLNSTKTKIQFSKTNEKEINKILGKIYPKSIS